MVAVAKAGLQCLTLWSPPPCGHTYSHEGGRERSRCTQNGKSTRTSWQRFSYQTNMLSVHKTNASTLQPPCIIIVQGVLFRTPLWPPHRSFSGVARAELQPRAPPPRPLPPLPRCPPSRSPEARVPARKAAVGLFHPSHAQSGRSSTHLKLQPWRADPTIPWPDMQEDAGSSWSMSISGRFS